MFFSEFCYLVNCFNSVYVYVFLVDIFNIKGIDPCVTLDEPHVTHVKPVTQCDLRWPQVDMGWLQVNQGWHQVTLGDPRVTQGWPHVTLGDWLTDLLT